MRRMIAILLLLAALVALAGCGAHGDTDRVRLEIQDAGDYEKSEIHAAMNAAMQEFRREAVGCSLLRLRFDAGYSDAWLTANGGEPDGTALVLLANYIDEAGNEQSGLPWSIAKSGDKWKADKLF